METLYLGGSRGGTGDKTQVAIGFLRYTGTDPPREAIGPRVQLLLGGGPFDLLLNTLIPKNVFNPPPPPLTGYPDPRMLYKVFTLECGSCIS